MSRIHCLFLTNGKHNVLQNVMNGRHAQSGTKRDELGFTERQWLHLRIISIVFFFQTGPGTSGQNLQVFKHPPFFITRFSLDKWAYSVTPGQVVGYL